MATIAEVGEPVPPTYPFEAVSVASAVSTIWRQQPASLDHQPNPASMQLLEIVEPVVSVQTLNLSAC